MPDAMDWIIANESVESMFGHLWVVMQSIYDATHKLQTNKWGVYSFVTKRFLKIAERHNHKA
ncbi:hypothetical protein BDI4_100047 [Burkholderia diffusa]|nr:hypothetical protein BDI4_100047 [Burkholderia diffusa]